MKFHADTTEGLDDAPRSWGEVAWVVGAAFCDLAAAFLVGTAIVVSMLLLKGTA